MRSRGRSTCSSATIPTTRNGHKDESGPVPFPGASNGAVPRDGARRLGWAMGRTPCLPPRPGTFSLTPGPSPKGRGEESRIVLRSAPSIYLWESQP